MADMPEMRPVGRAGPNGTEFEYWRNHTQISLQPLAAPSILGLYGLAGATFIVAANLAGWYGTGVTPEFLFPFAAIFGGLAQFLAGMWAFRARDALATAMHGMWGSFWIGYGVLFLLVATGVLGVPTPFVAFGYWFIVLAAITWVGAAAALAENIGLTLVLAVLGAGATLLAIGFIGGSAGVLTAAGWILLGAAALAFYVASAMLLESTYKRVILPLGRIHGPNTPGALPRRAIQFDQGEPGVKIGQ